MDREDWYALVGALLVFAVQLAAPWLVLSNP